MRRRLSLVLEAESLCKSPQATAYEGPYQWNTNQSHVSGQWGSMNPKPSSLYKKLGSLDEKLIKTSIMISGADESLFWLRELHLWKLAVGSKTLATASFVVEIRGSYNLILGRDWIHAHRCVPLSLHRFLIQWVDDKIEVVHADTSTCIAMADAPLLVGHAGISCFDRSRPCWFCTY